MADRKKGGKLSEFGGSDRAKRKPAKLEYRGSNPESAQPSAVEGSKLRDQPPRQPSSDASTRLSGSEVARTTLSSPAVSVTGESISSARKPRKIALNRDRDPVTGQFSKPIGSGINTHPLLVKPTSSKQTMPASGKGVASSAPFVAKSTRSIGTNVVPNALPLPDARPIVRGLVVCKEVRPMFYAGEDASLRASIQKLSLDTKSGHVSKLITTSAKLAFSPATTSSGTSPSLPPTVVSEPTQDRKGNAKFWTDLVFEDGHSYVRRTSDGKHHWLRLTAGQGGTFSYGDKFKNERGETVYAAGAKITSKKIHHLQNYGADIKFIGTEECCTCLGIYFEIAGNRVFCAHVNAWMGTDLHMNPPARYSVNYYDIKQAFLKKLTEHAAEHGWGPESVKKDSIKLVSIFPHAVGLALQDALAEMLALPTPPHTRRAHGFIILPGFRTNDNRMAIATLGTEVVGYRTDDDGDAEEVEGLASAPDRYRDHPFVNLDGTRVVEDWMYTIGTGWHHT